MADFANAVERIESMLEFVPGPNSPEVTAADVGPEMYEPLQRISRALVDAYGHDDRPVQHLEAAATALLYGFQDDDLIDAMASGRSASAWWLGVMLAVGLAGRLRYPDLSYRNGLASGT